jgi:ABC-type sugar transport system ATPase subunit
VIQVEKIGVRAGDFRLEDVSLEVPTGGYAALMGKTGSGKTTLLEVVAGLKPVFAGRIALQGIDVTRRKPAERNLGYVPQDGALFTRMTVREHLGFALVIRRWTRAAMASRIQELARLLEIEHLLDRTPTGLSGGERQRVALGRALSFHPRTLCLDEPLSALDDATRSQLYDLLRHVRRETGVTTLHVTHSLHEAQQLADIIYRLESGRVVPLTDRATA